MKLEHLMQSLADDPLWICRARSNYKRRRCRAPASFKRLRAATPLLTPKPQSPRRKTRV